MSSKLPAPPATATVTSLPTTRAATIVSASDWVGLTLPGMMEEPGSLAGIRISPMPQRGPLASQRTSLAILLSAPAAVLSAPETATSPSLPAIEAKRFGASVNASPVRSASAAAIFRA